MSTKQEQVQGYFHDTYRKGLGLLESTVVAAGDIPLSVASKLGVSDDKTTTVRDKYRSLTRSVYSGFETAGDGIASVAGKSATYAKDAAEAAGKLVPSKS